MNNNQNKIKRTKPNKECECLYSTTVNKYELAELHVQIHLQHYHGNCITPRRDEWKNEPASAYERVLDNRTKMAAAGAEMFLSSLKTKKDSRQQSSLCNDNVGRTKTAQVFGCTLERVKVRGKAEKKRENRARSPTLSSRWFVAR